MKKLNFIFFLVIFSTYGKSLADECDETETSVVEECNETEYSSYIDCVRRRTKRHAGCSQSCDSCNCNSCSSGECNSHCNTCCGNFEQPCETRYCCYKTCHSQCSNQGCRDSCRRTCSDRITNGNQYHTKEIITQTGAGPQAPNITTIINLHNKINNTNIIDVPINLKTDNINNITINTNDLMNGTYGGGQRCCQLVSPRQCTPTPTYPFMRCYHLRKRTCGNICRANIMHAQPHQICDQREVGPPDCHNQVIYIPQPQPRCAYRSEWPYVSCNIPTANCEGCYEHYATDSEKPSHCPQTCYGDGYGVGPHMPGYQPSYRPNYMPMQQYPGYHYPPPSGGGAGYEGSMQQPLPFSSIGYDPSAYENAFVVQRNADEGADLSKIFPNPTQNDDYDAQTLPITNSITQQQPSTLVDPTLVKIETVNATDVLMTIKEMNDEESSVDEDDVTVLPTNAPSVAMDPNMFPGDMRGAMRTGRDDKKVKASDLLSVMMADEEVKKDLTTVTIPKKDEKA